MSNFVRYDLEMCISFQIYFINIMVVLILLHYAWFISSSLTETNLIIKALFFIKKVSLFIIT